MIFIEFVYSNYIFGLEKEERCGNHYPSNTASPPSSGPSKGPAKICPSGK